MNQEQVTKKLFFIVLLCASFELVTSQDSRKRARSALETFDVGNGDSDHSGESRTSLSSDNSSSSTCTTMRWNCDTTLPVVGYAAVSLKDLKEGKNLREKYNILLARQRIDLIRRFCTAINIDIERYFLDYNRKSLLSASKAQSLYEFRSRATKLNIEDVCRCVKSEIVEYRISVVTASQEDLEDLENSNDIYSLFNLNGMTLVVYPSFFEKTVPKQLADLRRVIERIKVNDMWLISLMKKYLDKQTDLSIVEKGDGLLKEMRYFCTRSEYIKAFFAETRDDVRDILTKECIAPIHYIKELTDNIKEDDRLKWESLVSKDRLARDCAVPVLNNNLVANEFPDISTEWAIKVIVARSKYRLHQRDSCGAKIKEE